MLLYVGKGKSRGIVIAFMIAYIVISVVGMLMCDIQVAIPCLVGALLAFLYYCYVAFHHFGELQRISHASLFRCVKL